MRRDIWLVPAADSAESRPFIQTEFDERSIALSPDGQWLAYVSDATGQDQVFVRPVPGPGGQNQVSIDGGMEPMWSMDGSKVYYRSRTHMMAVAVQTTPNFSVGTRERLFEDVYVKNTSVANYDVHPEDGRFLMISGATEIPSLVVVLNWYEELRQRTGGN